MAHGKGNKVLPIESNHFRSTFTLTFAVEVHGMEVWEDCREGWLEQGPCTHGLRLQCLLYPGHAFDLDIMIWPHTAKIWCGLQSGWVRVWQLLERRWLAFSIRFAFAVRVQQMESFVATIIPTHGVASFGASAKSDKESTVYLPPLDFGVKRYFAPVLTSIHEDTLKEFVQHFIWHSVEQYIPSSCFDGTFDVPEVVKDKRHQDACIDTVRDHILSRLEPSEEEIPEPEPESIPKVNKKEIKPVHKEKEKKKLEYKLTGENILAGAGRVVPFETVGEQAPDSPEIIVLISSNNLPAQDDLPIVFLNVENLFQIPLNELKILRVTHLYVRWQIGEDINTSEPMLLKSQSMINFNNHRALPIPYELLPKITSVFLETCFKIELRGIRLSSVTKRALLFGYEKGDRAFGRYVPKPPEEELDFLIATTHIDAKHLARGINAFIKGEYPLYPPKVAVKPLERESYCTNDINHIRKSIQPILVVPPSVVLEAQMTLEVSMGVVGCKARTLSECFSRIFSLIRDSESVMAVIRCIQDINEEIMLSEKREDLLSGFALDTGSVVVFYVEGPRECHILRVWEMTEDYYSKMKPVFSSSDRYSSRLYPELITTAVPFIVLKMFMPIGVMLACPPVYSRPALPLPTRAALLKIGRLIICDSRTVPSRCHMPTTAELKSFRLELCAAPRPTPVTINDFITVQEDTTLRPTQHKINWHK